MNRRRRKLFSLLTDWTVGLSRRGRETLSRSELHSFDFDSNVNRWPLRMSDSLRTRLRRRWLRIRSDD
jgi:hypothetical protein